MEETEEEQRASVVLDVGSSYTRVGFADDYPVAIVRTAVERKKHTGIMVGMSANDVYVGEEAISRRGMRKVVYPVQRGEVSDWANYERLVRRVLGLDKMALESLAGRALLLCVHPLLPDGHREAFAKLAFDKLQCTSLALVPRPVGSLLCGDYSTGVVLGIGDGYAHATPVYEHRVVRSAVRTGDVAGHALTEYYRKLLEEVGYSFTTAAEIEIVRDIKAKMGRVAPAAGEFIDPRCCYELPDGQVVSITETCSKFAEALFDPTLVGAHCKGVHHLVAEAIEACPLWMREEMYGNIHVAGGTTCLRGFEERLERELKAIVPPSTSLCVHAPVDPRITAFLGAAIMSELGPQLSLFAVSRRQYEAAGAGAMHTAEWRSFSFSPRTFCLLSAELRALVRLLCALRVASTTLGVLPDDVMFVLLSAVVVQCAGDCCTAGADKVPALAEEKQAAGDDDVPIRTGPKPECRSSKQSLAALDREECEGTSTTVEESGETSEVTRDDGGAERRGKRRCTVQ